MMCSCDEENEAESCEILSTLQLPQFLLGFFIHLRLHNTSPPLLSPVSHHDLLQYDVKTKTLQPPFHAR